MPILHFLKAYVGMEGHQVQISFPKECVKSIGLSKEK